MIMFMALQSKTNNKCGVSPSNRDLNCNLSLCERLASQSLLLKSSLVRLKFDIKYLI